MSGVPPIHGRAQSQPAASALSETNLNCTDSWFSFAAWSPGVAFTRSISASRARRLPQSDGHGLSPNKSFSPLQNFCLAIGHLNPFGSSAGLALRIPELFLPRGRAGVSSALPQPKPLPIIDDTEPRRLQYRGRDPVQPPSLVPHRRPQPWSAPRPRSAAVGRTARLHRRGKLDRAWYVRPAPLGRHANEVTADSRTAGQFNAGPRTAVRRGVSR